MVFVQEKFERFRVTKDIDDMLSIESNYEDFEDSAMIVMREGTAKRLKQFLNENF